jgi:hypothetical protein
MIMFLYSRGRTELNQKKILTGYSEIQSGSFPTKKLQLQPAHFIWVCAYTQDALLNLSLKTGYPDQVFSWFSSVPPRKGKDSPKSDHDCVLPVHQSYWNALVTRQVISIGNWFY